MVLQVDLTPNGKQMLSNFLIDICQVIPSYTMSSRKEECLKYIKERVGYSKVLVSIHTLQPSNNIFKNEYYLVTSKWRRRFNCLRCSITSRSRTSPNIGGAH